MTTKPPTERKPLTLVPPAAPDDTDGSPAPCLACEGLKRRATELEGFVRYWRGRAGAAPTAVPPAAPEPPVDPEPVTPPAPAPEPAPAWVQDPRTLKLLRALYEAVYDPDTTPKQLSRVIDRVEAYLDEVDAS